MHQHSCSSLVLTRARAFRLAAGGVSFRTARFSASRECVPSRVPLQDQQALRSAPALLVCSHVVFCFRCAQVLPTFKSLIVPRDQAVGASDGSGVSPPPVSVARRRSSSHLAARALLARSPVAFCFCCAQEQSPSNSEQSHYPATVASEPVHKPADGAFFVPGRSRMARRRGRCRMARLHIHAACAPSRPL